MKTRIRFKLGKGQTKHSAITDLARYMWKYFRTKDIDGKTSMEHTTENGEIRKVIDRYLLKHKLVAISDKMNIDRYQLFLERLTSYIMHRYLTNPEKDNEFFIPGLLNDPGVGFFLADSHKEVKQINKVKSILISGMEHKLASRIVEADKRVTSEKKIELLSDNVEVA